MALILKSFDVGPMQNVGYLIGDDMSKKAILVDPAWEADTFLRMAEEAGLTVAGLAVTHAHYDHTNAIEELLNTLDVPVYANRNEVPYAKSGSSIVGTLGRTVRPTEGGEKISLGDVEIEFLHTPGHTPGSQCLKVGTSLLTGDTLFVGGCGRSDLPGGDAATLFRSLKKIATLPAELEVCPAHDYGDVRTRPLREELAANPYLKMRDENDFLNAVG